MARIWGPRLARTVSRVAVVSLLALCAACESGPSGPGSLDAVVESARRIAGGVVLEVRGTGIRGFGSQGSTQVFWEAQQEPGAFKVVVLNPGEAAPLSFTVQVDDLGAVPPTGTVLEATSLANMPMGDLSDFQVRVVP